LQNAVGSHLELLRPQQGVNQVRKKKDGGDAANQIIHNSSISWPRLQAVACFGEEPAKQEERQGNQDINKVKHIFPCLSVRPVS
jgi:hypothetical protein